MQNFKISYEQVLIRMGANKYKTKVDLKNEKTILESIEFVEKVLKPKHTISFATKKESPYLGKKQEKQIKSGKQKNSKEYLLKIIFFSNFNKTDAKKKKIQVIGIYQVGTLCTYPVVNNITVCIILLTPINGLRL